MPGHTPPGATPFPPGTSGNPEGRKTAGATLREWLNVFAEQGLTEAQLRDVFEDDKAPFPKRAAAMRALRLLETGNVADFEDVIHGSKTLKELRLAGVDTACVKKLKLGKHGVEIELRDRAGEEFDRISDRTEGKPAQAVDLTSGGSPIRLAPIVLDGDKQL